VYTGPPIAMTSDEEEHLAEILTQYLAQSGPKVVDESTILAEAARLGLSDEMEAQISMSGRSSGSVSLAAAQSILLNLTQEPQTKGYYCGPAVGSEIIKSPLFASMRSAKDGSAISQSSMANANHMKTDANQVTSWASKNFVNGLNAWTGGAKHKYAQYSTPSSSTVIAALTTVMIGGAPIAVDAVEQVGGTHYNGHPNRLIGHWLASYYYGNYGATVGFADSTAGSSAVSGYGAAQPKFTYDTASFVNTFLQSNGAAY
jgi:uncharacterized Zn-binding protein involved in type VI secretion